MQSKNFLHLDKGCAITLKTSVSTRFHLYKQTAPYEENNVISIAFSAIETNHNIFRLTAKVTKYELDTFFASHRYWCRCEAWNKTGLVKSKKATVRLACKCWCLS